eukprot:gnl/TRDRNA2_/TRDRNA2_167700_c0_seq2.p1 gnl/TRDRNA2_/TRDRNA2_167700_c0~~gnl/TRDRNA2_/TRDRNA2_167700_c0_seq2.p1  ORF type:complete len:107 (-),score=9.44 gnl/TRDRNA2_/TRDRNA2_167700_c0_seq2:102-422(-)
MLRLPLASFLILPGTPFHLLTLRLRTRPFVLLRLLFSLANALHQVVFNALPSIDDCRLDAHARCLFSSLTIFVDHTKSSRCSTLTVSIIVGQHSMCSKARVSNVAT